MWFSRHTQSLFPSTGATSAPVEPSTSPHWENSSPSASTALYPRAASSLMTVDLPVPDIPVKSIRFMTSSPSFPSKTDQPDQPGQHGRSLIGEDLPVFEISRDTSLLR